jgi:threonine dehydrogenase-like Zn-dependent dehydrogenase
MCAAIFQGPRSITVGDRPDPTIEAPTDAEVPFESMFFKNVGWRGGPAPSRNSIPELMPDVLEGRIDPGRVLDFETDLDGIAGAYAAMDERRTITSLVRIGTV